MLETRKGYGLSDNKEKKRAALTKVWLWRRQRRGIDPHKRHLLRAGGIDLLKLERAVRELRAGKPYDVGPELELYASGLEPCGGRRARSRKRSSHSVCINVSAEVPAVGQPAGVRGAAAKTALKWCCNERTGRCLT